MRAKVREPQVADPGRHHPTLPAGILSHPQASRSPVPEHSLLPHSLPFAGPRASSDHEPFIWPVVGPLNSPYGPRRSRFHAGIDIGAAHAHPVVAAGGGRVVYARATRGPLGKTVVLEHADGLRTLYAHLSRIVAKEGALVRQGDRIGAVGRTGRATGPHLHFEIHRHGAPVAPQAFLPGPPGELVGLSAPRSRASEAHVLPSQPLGVQPAAPSPAPSQEPTS
jgi:murein DD-endopeptidase MepM/ murein hydrolase activator NlpD